MSSDIYFNGTAYPGRTGSLRWGTYFNQVQPAGSFTTQDQMWGSRLAEMTGRVRGISGTGTIDQTAGTNQITFPVGMFNYTPIIDIHLLKVQEDFGIIGQNGGFDSKFVSNWLFPRDTSLIFQSVVNPVFNINSFTINPKTFNINVVDVDNTGFKIVQFGFTHPISLAYGQAFYWHAFGI